VFDVQNALTREQRRASGRPSPDRRREVNVACSASLHLEEFRQIVIRRRAGRGVSLRRRARRGRLEDVRRVARAQTESAQGMGIRKQRGANAVACCNRREADDVEMQKSLPRMDFSVNSIPRNSSKSRSTRSSSSCSSRSFYALVCWMFLGRSRAPSTSSSQSRCRCSAHRDRVLPRLTLNTFTLLGLALAVGIVVDDAIMVMENIYRMRRWARDACVPRARERSRLRSRARRDTRDLRDLRPVVFMGGVIEVFLQFGVTLCVAVLLSYVEP